MTNVIPFAVRAEINLALSAVATGRTAASVVAKKRLRGLEAALRKSRSGAAGPKKTSIRRRKP